MTDNYGRYRSDVPDIVDRISNIERRLQAVESVSQLGNATIDKGALQIRDATGDVRVRVGLLSDGTYGIEMKESGQDNFHQTPYLYSDFVTSVSGDTCSSNVYGDLATFGPSVTVQVRTTARFFVIATAQVQSTGVGAVSTLFDGRFDVAFSGANTRSPNETSDPLVGVVQTTHTVSTGTIAVAPIYTIVASTTFTGLNVGSTTVTVKYRRANGVAADPQFFRRNLAVIVF